MADERTNAELLVAIVDAACIMQDRGIVTDEQCTAGICFFTDRMLQHGELVHNGDKLLVWAQSLLDKGEQS